MARDMIKEHAAMRQMLADLIEWDTYMSEFDNPVWRRARKLMEKIRDAEDAEQSEHA